MQRTSRESTVYPITVRELDVLRVEDLSPGMRRVVLGGAGLAEHERNGVAVPAFQSTGFDDDVKVIVPDPVNGPCPIPEPQPSGILAWTEESIALARAYTVRSFDAVAQELAIDFALHDTGLASTWSRRVTPGEAVYIAGPKASASLPVHTDWLLLIGDETALPAIHRCLDELPTGVRARAFIEVAEAAHRLDIQSNAELELTWVVRAEGADLVSVVQSAPWWEGTPFVWIAGEALSIKPLRRWIKDERGVPREHTDISGYWRKREVVALDDDAQSVDVNASGPDAEARIHELTELAPALAVRTAVSLDLFRLIDDGASSAEALAARVGLPVSGLTRLLRYLSVLDFISFGTDQDLGLTELGLTELGEILAEPDSRLAHSLDEAATLRELSLTGLLPALRTGSAVPVLGTGRNWIQLTTENQHLAVEVAATVAEQAWFTAPALPEALGLTVQDLVAFAGPGAEVFAEETQRRVPGIAAEVLGGAKPAGDAFAGVDLAQVAELRGRTDQAGTRVTLIVIDPFGSLPARELVAFLDASLVTADRVVAISAILDEQSPEELDLEEDLRRLCLYGGELPTRARLSQIAADAHGIVQQLTAVGWGQWAITLGRIFGNSDEA